MNPTKNAHPIPEPSRKLDPDRFPSTMVRALRWLDSFPPDAVGIVGGFLICVIGVLNYLIGPKLSASLLFLIPILLVTWASGFRPGILGATVAAFVWLLAELHAEDIFAHPVIPYWNFLMRIGTFLVAVGLVSAMRSLNTHLEERVHERTAELESQIAENRQLEQTLLEISDKERATVGQDLHDGLCQQLVSAAFSTNMLNTELTQNSQPGATETARIADMIDEAITQARNLARGLYPVRLETEGLEIALRELASTTSRRFDIECVVECPKPLPTLRTNSAIQLYRIIQEAVVNSAKHSKAKSLIVRLSVAALGVRIEISDDGIGIENLPVNPVGMGLKIMEYRARMIGATFKIQPRPHGGTHVVCELTEPLQPA